MGGGPAKEKLLCLLPSPEPKDITASLRDKFPHIDIVYQEVKFNPKRTAFEYTLDPAIYADVTILYTLFSFPEKLSQAPHLKWVHLFSAGSNHIQKHPIYKDTDKILLTTSSGVHGPQISEWLLMTALVQSHRFTSFYELQKKHQWGQNRLEKEDPKPLRDRVGLRLGVLGYGSIGRQTARVASAMGMDVIAYTATPKDTLEKKRDHGYIVPGTGDVEGQIPKQWFSGLEKSALHHFLKQDIDWLVVSVPLTDDTRGFLGKEEFDVLSHGGKRPTFVSNIARGPIIQTKELVAALKDGRVSGAALDVTDPEPLPEDSELWDMQNVTITPHISGVSDAYGERSFAILELNLPLFIKGEKLVNQVNRKTGY